MKNTTQYIIAIIIVSVVIVFTVSCISYPGNDGTNDRICEERFETIYEQSLHNGYSRRLVILRDRETGVNYLYNGETGLCVLVDAYGKPVVTPDGDNCDQLKPISERLKTENP